jgi:CxxC motif-containing protein (DUF1111 family)
MAMGVGVLMASTLVACAVDPPETTVPWEPGAPLQGLSPGELVRFAAGRDLFDRDFTEAEGLGPAYNQMRCSSCHDLPTVGGSGVERVLKSSRWGADGCDPLVEEGGETVQPRITELLRSLGGSGETLPPSATHAVDLVATALYGMGLIEAIPDDEILSRVDPEDRDGDGISGRAGVDAQGRLARFGHKATDATLKGFIEGALLQEMGLTTVAHPHELSINGRPLPGGADPAPDPEVGPEEVDALLAYIRFLAPPEPAVPPGREERRVVARGEGLFQEVGCTLCHVPEMRTRADVEPRILADRPVRLYTDLLLHDLGPEVEGICSASASPTEVRTAPLAGLRFRPLLMHDGGASDLRDVIRRHGGEAAGSRGLFDALSPGDQSALLAFLGTL